MINAALYDGSGRAVPVAPPDISEVVGKPNTVLWVDAAEPTAEDLECIRTEFQLHHLAIEDASKHGQRPKLEQYPTHAFVVAYGGNLAEVDLFVGEGWVVTVRDVGEDGQAWDPEPARRRFERSGPEEATAGFLLYMLLDTMVDEYFTRADAFEERIEKLEEGIFEEDARDEARVQNEIYALRSDLLAFRRRVQPLRDVVTSLLRHDVEWVDALATTHLQDVFDHVLRALDQLDSQRELLGNAVDAHLAIISNRMNEVMKKMTSWGAILLGATLVAGIYGMNFQHMPELGWRWGYAWALGLMATITLAGWSYFRRKDWL
ncbi:MAG TPA: magnesium/cobalt transporter CorA [Acidimicrobiales bacterium]